MSSTGTYTEDMGSSPSWNEVSTADSTVDIDHEDMLKDHLSGCPNALLDQLTTRDDIIEMLRALDAEEVDPTLLATDLLNWLSKEIHRFVLADHPERLQGGVSNRIVFVLYDSLDYERTPWKRLGPPRVVGVEESDALYQFRVMNGENASYIDIPLHRIETLVEARALHSPENRSLAPCYSSMFLEARLDRIGFYCFSIHQRGWSVHYADYTGVIGSPVYKWNAGRLADLASYVYSLYIPPHRHYARDPTITWDVSLGERQAVQKIQVDEEEFPVARTLIPGHIGRKRTTIYIAGQGVKGCQAIIKDCYCGLHQGYHEPAILQHIHSQGFVPGVVRLAGHELVEFFDGDRVAYIETVRPEFNACAKHRMVLADMGESLLLAKSVNDLLMAVYDVLEVHRTLAGRAKILHRDISIGNILMYPKMAPCANYRAMDDAPMLIDDVLAGEPRAPERRIARCLLIDFDLAIKLLNNRDPQWPSRELRNRAGTPSFVSRATAAGRVLFTKHSPLKMPLLSDGARELYVHAYGQERYDKYCDGQGKYHGGVPAEHARAGTSRRYIPYQHRWEYDVESVYWTLYSVLLRVLPRGFSETRETDCVLQRYWEILMGHQFLQSDECENLPQDRRSPLLDCDLDAFLKPFPAVMQDAACLLYDIAQHVRIPYASMAELPEFEDHLHEAAQRLILEYLIRHKDDPIYLTPGELRIGDAPGAVAERFDADVRGSLDSSSMSDVSTVDTTDPEGRAECVNVPEQVTSRVPPLLDGRWNYPYFGEEYILEEEDV